MTQAIHPSVSKIISTASQSSAGSIGEIEAAARRLRDLMEKATGRAYRFHVDVPMGFAMVAERMGQDGGTS